MSPKEYLSQYKNMVLEISMMEESIRELNERATSITSSTDSDKVQGAGDKDKVGLIVSKIADMQGECREKMAAALDIRNEIETTILGIEEPKFRAVLHLRYIGLLKWEEIADKMGYEKRHITRLHGNALLKVKL